MYPYSALDLIKLQIQNERYAGCNMISQTGAHSLRLCQYCAYSDKNISHEAIKILEQLVYDYGEKFGTFFEYGIIISRLRSLMNSGDPLIRNKSSKIFLTLTNGVQSNFFNGYTDHEWNTHDGKYVGYSHFNKVTSDTPFYRPLYAAGTDVPYKSVQGKLLQKPISKNSIGPSYVRTSEEYHHNDSTQQHGFYCDIYDVPKLEYFSSLNIPPGISSKHMNERPKMTSLNSQKSSVGNNNRTVMKRDIVAENPLNNRNNIFRINEEFGLNNGNNWNNSGINNNVKTEVEYTVAIGIQDNNLRKQIELNESGKILSRRLQRQIVLLPNVHSVSVCFVEADKNHPPPPHTDEGVFSDKQLNSKLNSDPVGLLQGIAVVCVRVPQYTSKDLRMKSFEDTVTQVRYILSPILSNTVVLQIKKTNAPPLLQTKGFRCVKSLDDTGSSEFKKQNHQNAFDIKSVESNILNQYNNVSVSKHDNLSTEQNSVLINEVPELTTFQPTTEFSRNILIKMDQDKSNSKHFKTNDNINPSLLKSKDSIEEETSAGGLICTKSKNFGTKFQTQFQNESNQFRTRTSTNNDCISSDGGDSTIKKHENNISSCLQNRNVYDTHKISIKNEAVSSEKFSSNFEMLSNDTLKKQGLFTEKILMQQDKNNQKNNLDLSNSNINSMMNHTVVLQNDTYSPNDDNVERDSRRDSTSNATTDIGTKVNALSDAGEEGSDVVFSFMKHIDDHNSLLKISNTSIFQHSTHKIADARRNYNGEYNNMGEENLLHKSDSSNENRTDRKQIRDNTVKEIGDNGMDGKEIGNYGIKQESIGDSSIEKKSIEDNRIEDEDLGDNKIEDEGLGDNKIEDEGLGDNKIEDEGLGDNKIEDEGLGDNKIEQQLIGENGIFPTSTPTSNSTNFLDDHYTAQKPEDKLNENTRTKSIDSNGAKSKNSVFSSETDDIVAMYPELPPTRAWSFLSRTSFLFTDSVYLKNAAIVHSDSVKEQSQRLKRVKELKRTKSTGNQEVSTYDRVKSGVIGSLKLW